MPICWSVTNWKIQLSISGQSIKLPLYIHGPSHPGCKICDITLHQLAVTISRINKLAIGKTETRNRKDRNGQIYYSKSLLKWPPPKDHLCIETILCLFGATDNLMTELCTDMSVQDVFAINAVAGHMSFKN